MTPKVIIGIPASEETKFKFTLSLAQLCAYRSDKYLLSGLVYGQGCYVHENRNKIVNAFKDADWLLQLDTDIIFEITLIDKLLQLAENTKSRVVAGWYMNIVQNKYIPLVYRKKDNNYIFVLPSGDSPISVDIVGTGCLMVHKEVFEKIKKDTASPWFYFDELNGKTVGEDFVFCQNARNAGYNIFIDPELRVKHLKLGEV
jgi:GT2 family glycosyltransferase